MNRTCNKAVRKAVFWSFNISCLVIEKNSSTAEEWDVSNVTHHADH